MRAKSLVLPVRVTVAMETASVLGGFLLLLALGSVETFDNSKIGDHLMRIFLTDQIIVDNEVSVLQTAKKSYHTLVELNKSQNLKSQSTVGRAVSRFLADVATPVEKGDTNLHSVLRDVTLYVDPEHEDTLGPAVLERDFVEGLLQEVNCKLQESGRKTHDVPRLLAMNDTELCSLLRQEADTDPSSVGFFFLEVFATVVGLSWGIVSMFL